MSLSVAQSTDGARVAVTFAHEKGNIITSEIVRELRAVLEDLLDARPLKLVTIEGAGPDFSFGASVPEHTAEEIRAVLPEMHDLIRELVALPAATAAIVRGRCLGGGFELALACDFIFAADDASFGLPEIALGVFPPAGSVLLPARAGAARATAAILTGDARPADYWHHAGVVTAVAPGATLKATIDDWYARTLARYSAESLRHAVRVARLPVANALDLGLADVETLYLSDLMVTHDANEGVRAFLEKRAPIWKDE
jgi:cyclohexa-1,5-dienecarbonyl-CoA hydratase